jgi:hypothetical protein
VIFASFFYDFILQILKNIFVLFQKSEESSALSIFDNITERVAETRRLLVCLLSLPSQPKIIALAWFYVRVPTGFGLELLLFSHFAKAIYKQGFFMYCTLSTRILLPPLRF